MKTKEYNLVKAVKMSATMKLKNGWIRDGGSGFIVADIHYVYTPEPNTVTIQFHWPHTQTFKLSDLNLRETEELLSFLETAKKPRHERGCWFQ